MIKKLKKEEEKMKRMSSLFTLMISMHWVIVCKQVSIRTSGGSSTRSTHQVKPKGVTLPDCKRKTQIQR